MIVSWGGVIKGQASLLRKPPQRLEIPELKRDDGLILWVFRPLLVCLHRRLSL